MKWRSLRIRINPTAADATSSHILLLGGATARGDGRVVDGRHSWRGGLLQRGEASDPRNGESGSGGGRDRTDRPGRYRRI